MMCMMKIPHSCSTVDAIKSRVWYSLKTCRSLSDQRKRIEHLILTAKQPRQMKSYRGIVHELSNGSQTVKLLRLKIEESGFSFNAGQWIDFSIPGIEQVAGYSMTSSPKLAAEQGQIDLAVKYSKYPPTHWIHTQCKVGDAVTVQVGGDFFYDPQPESKDVSANLLLVGGGVGINPMVSIVKHYCDIVSTKCQGVKPGKLNLLYSAQTEDDLVFREEFMKLQEQIPSISCKFFITNERSFQNIPEYIMCRRIDKEDVKASIKDLQLHDTVCYVCGPSPMIDTMNSYLTTLGISPENIKFEKWW